MFQTEDLRLDIKLTRRNRRIGRIENRARMVRNWRFSEGGFRQIRPGTKRQATIRIYVPDSNQYILLSKQDLLAMGHLIQHQGVRGYSQKHKWSKAWEFYKPQA